MTSEEVKEAYDLVSIFWATHQLLEGKVKYPLYYAAELVSTTKLTNLVTIKISKGGSFIQNPVHEKKYQRNQKYLVYMSHTPLKIGRGRNGGGTCASILLFIAKSFTFHIDQGSTIVTAWRNDIWGMASTHALNPCLRRRLILFSSRTALALIALTEVSLSMKTQY